MLSLMITSLHAAINIGETLFSRGITMAETQGGIVRVLGKGAEVYEGDIISTGDKSFVVISFNDGTRMSLRPNTVFELELFEKENNKADVRLLSGGFRAQTGSISQVNPEGFKLHIKETVTSIRDAEFDVRLCKEECEQEAEQYQLQEKSNKLVIGRIAEFEGNISVTNIKGGKRLAVKGAPLYEGDIVSSEKGSYAVIAFRDKGVITLQEQTEFKIKDLKFLKGQASEGKASFDLLRGGLRALTGLIGKQDREDYKVITPVATIGIRGTGFDLVCEGRCVNPDTETIIDNAALSIGDGLYASVWQGTIVLKTPQGNLILKKGGVVIVPNAQSKPALLPKSPSFLDNNPAPRPDRLEIDYENLFSSYPFKAYRLGLFFVVYKGHLATDTQDAKHLDLGIEEASSYDVDLDNELFRLERIPPLLQDDPYFQMIEETFWGNYDDIDENFDDFFECTIQ